jgi:chemotaxis protein methyltransferase CheR
MNNDNLIYKDVKDLLYNLIGITLSDNKDLMINNRLEKLLRNTNYKGEIKSLIQEIKDGKYTTEFINTFTTNKTNFFREEFHFIDLKNRVLSHNSNLKIYCCAASTGEEPYSIAMTLKEVSKYTNAKIIATDIDTEVLKTAATGIYKYQKTPKEFPSWIDISKYFKKRELQGINNKTLIKVNDDIKQMITFAKMNLNCEVYPFESNEFDVIFCRNVLIYFSLKDQEIILKKLFMHLKIGGTLYLGHSESPQSLINYCDKMGQNIFIKTKDIL